MSVEYWVTTSGDIMKQDIEFKVGDIVTLDRYNHIEDVHVVKIVNIVDDHFTDKKLYVMDVNGVHIRSTGISIMESKYYKPVNDEDRHEKIDINN